MPTTKRQAPGSERQVATIKLTDAMRKQILKQLQLDEQFKGDFKKIPGQIRVTRVPHEAVGLSEREAIVSANSWVLVLV